MIPNIIIVFGFLFILIVPIFLPNSYGRYVFWKNDDAIFDKLFKTSRVAVLVTALFTFLYVVKPKYDNIYLKKENKELRLEKKELDLNNRKLSETKYELENNLKLIENQYNAKEKDFRSLSNDYQSLKVNSENLESVNIQLEKEKNLISSKRDSLISIRIRLEKNITTLEESTERISLFSVAKDLVDFKQSKYGIFENDVNFRIVVKEFLKREPIEEDSEMFSVGFYDSKVKKSLLEYSNLVNEDEQFSIERAYGIVSFFLYGKIE